MSGKSLSSIAFWRSVATGLLLVALSGCGNSQQDAAKIVVTGSSTVAPLMIELGKRFESQNPGVRVNVQTGGSSRGIADVRRNLADIGMVSRALKADEDDLTGYALAADGICMIVHSTNNIEMLTRAQIIAIYTGQVKNWKEFGGIDLPITVVNKAAGRSTLELFMSYFDLGVADIQASVIIGDNQHALKTVAGNRGAIAYVSIGTAEFSSADGIAIKLLPMDGIAANTVNVRNGTYPLSRQLTLVTAAQPGPLASRLIDFARSNQVARVIEEQYFVPLL